MRAPIFDQYPNLLKVGIFNLTTHFLIQVSETLNCLAIFVMGIVLYKCSNISLLGKFEIFFLFILIKCFLKCITQIIIFLIIFHKNKYKYFHIICIILYMSNLLYVGIDNGLYNK